MSLFDANALHRGYAFLDNVPSKLLEDLVGHPVGDLPERAAGLTQLRSGLLAGRTDLGDWPPEPTRSAVRRWLDQSGVLAFTPDQPELVDALLLDVLQLTAGAIHDEEGRAQALLAELVAREHARRVEVAKGGKPDAIDAPTRDRLRARARAEARQASADHVTAELERRWAEPIKVWTDLAGVFGDLGELLGLGRDLSRGLLRAQGWTLVEDLRRLLERVPALQDLVRQLGRLRTPEGDAPSVTETVFVGISRVAEELRETRSPLAPTETRGIERSGALSRMLPAEAVLLGHPVLRRLWHARRAENALMTYRVEGVLTERIRTDVDGVEARQAPRPKPERGPILVCLDTSGSMHGAPEIVAKAVTLEAMRVARAEKRACYLYAFSGPKDVVEHALDLSPAGITRLLAFLRMSFHGGTDVAEPMRRAVERLGTASWRRADVLLVSDGEFPVDAATSRRVAEARADLDARFHGLLVGGGAASMAQICDPVHRFLDWNALADGRRASP